MKDTKITNKEFRALSITIASCGILLIGSGLIMSTSNQTVVQKKYSIEISQRRIAESKTNEIKLKKMELEINNPLSVNVKDYLENSNEIEVRGLVLNNETKEVHVNGEEIKLTPMEFKILALLMENTGRVFPIEEIYERVWDEPFYNSENTVAVHIRRIREKIEINPKEPRYLKVVWGVGYKIEK